MCKSGHKGVGKTIIFISMANGVCLGVEIQRKVFSKVKKSGGLLKGSVPAFAFDMLYDLGESLELFSRQEINTESEHN